jgi:hypothetical protein
MLKCIIGNALAIEIRYEWSVFAENSCLPAVGFSRVVNEIYSPIYYENDSLLEYSAV